ncbi:DUF2267 domain-containing protein [Marimonas lutisalis]|uniref:DUF2267 domain-containing protein n=1 Tax=Marimonas lutisalis TaxID=2545756 RepID=UPI0010F6CDF5|nr:DUF2267 domain-containing protein [Marimonas lutisalis]
MPMPWSYRHATRDWQGFLEDAKSELALSSDNMAYTAVQGVLLTFRRRLTPAQGLAFADQLPAVLRAIFVADWDISSPPLPWADRATLTAEAKALRPDHNLTPDNAIAAVARALRAHVRQRDFDRALDALGPEARDFWHVDDGQNIRRKMT